jgi:hypothetical protein
MALVTDVAKRVEIPNEEGQWMEIKRLSWRQKELAREVASDKLLKKMKALGPEAIVGIQKIHEGKTEGTNLAAEYDMEIVLEVGISKWSYDEEVSKKTIGRLEEDTAKWAFNQILELDQPRTEEEIKNA